MKQLHVIYPAIAEFGNTQRIEIRLVEPDLMM